LKDVWRKHASAFMTFALASTNIASREKLAAFKMKLFPDSHKAAVVPERQKKTMNTSC